MTTFSIIYLTGCLIVLLYCVYIFIKEKRQFDCYDLDDIIITLIVILLSWVSIITYIVGRALSVEIKRYDDKNNDDKS